MSYKDILYCFQETEICIHDKEIKFVSKVKVYAPFD